MKESKLSYIALTISVGAAAFCGVSGMLSVFPNSSKIDSLTQQVHALKEQNASLMVQVGDAGENRVRINELDVGMTAVANVLKIDRVELAKAFAAVKAGQEAQARAAPEAQQTSEGPSSTTDTQTVNDTVKPISTPKQASLETPEHPDRKVGSTSGVQAPAQSHGKTSQAAETTRRTADSSKPATPLMGADNPFAASLDSTSSVSEEAPALAVEAPKPEPLTISQVDAVLAKRLSSNWYKPPGAADNLSAIIQLKMGRDGQVANVRMGKSSGNTAFDTSALSAVKSIGTIEEVRQLSEADFQKAYASRSIQFTPQMGR